MLQAATEQAARALALYAKEAQELRDHLAQAQAQLKGRGSSSFASILNSARRSFIWRDSSSAAQNEVNSRPLFLQEVWSPGITGLTC